jgi:hypothetical protein
MMAGLHRRPGVLADALNIMSTIMSGGYRFLKGEQKWGSFYRRVVAEMPGVRFSDVEVVRLAESFLCDLLWVVQKLERGELVAAQRSIHRSLLETNVILLHELRLRKGVPTFQQARRLEILLDKAELETVQVSARLEKDDLRIAAWRAFEGLRAVMRELLPEWEVPSRMRALLARHRGASSLSLT